MSVNPQLSDCTAVYAVALGRPAPYPVDVSIYRGKARILLPAEGVWGGLGGGLWHAERHVGSVCLLTRIHARV